MPKLVHVIDDDALFRTGIAHCLKMVGYDVVMYPSAKDFLNCLPGQNDFGCILLDLMIPELNGLETQSQLNKSGVTLPIVFLSGYADIQMAVRAIKAGAVDFLTKPVSQNDLVNALDRAFAHQSDMLRQSEKFHALRAVIALLTPRERQVFELVIRGNTNKQVGNVLGATERTIKAHRHKVMQKIEVQSLAELVSFAERAGILQKSAIE